jgi:hypothetical protein
MFTDFRIYNSALAADQVATLAEYLPALNSAEW